MKIRTEVTHAEAFRSLGHPKRLEILFHLVRARKELPAGDIQNAVGIPAPTLSHHLDDLYHAGLVERRKEERFVLYSVNKRMVNTLCRLPPRRSARTSRWRICGSRGRFARSPGRGSNSSAGCGRARNSARSRFRSWPLFL